MSSRFRWEVISLLLSLAVLAGWVFSSPPSPSPARELRAPAGDRPTQINATGETVLPNGRLITPVGPQIKVAPHPYGLALSPDGKTLVTANSGTAPFSVSIITGVESARYSVTQIPPGFKSADADPDSVLLGVAIGNDNRTLYLSEGNNGRVGSFDLVTHRRLSFVSLDGRFDGKEYAHSLTGELALSPDGSLLYVLDLAHFRLVIFDTKSWKMLSSLPVGRMPFGLTLSPDGQRAYVSNIGMFRYHLVPGYDRRNPEGTALEFPPYGFPSKEAREGTVVDGRKIPGLGDPNTPASNSLWVINVSLPSKPHVVAKVPTGTPVGEDSEGGSSPGAVAAGKQKVFVSNANQDSITVLDASTNRVENTVVLEPAESLRGLRGVLPFGLALSSDQKRLYVACAGINAVAVLDAAEAKVLGYIPAGWFPARVRVSADGKTLYVANAKGFGAGPNGGPNFHPGPEGAYIGDITKGTVSVIPVPSQDALAELTAEVLRNNGFTPVSVPEPSAGFPIPPPGRASAKIHHVVFIVKENRTFDEIFGDLKPAEGETVNGDESLARWGEDVGLWEEGMPFIEHARVTPNEHALARRFALSDNFYVDSDVSVDGHHWLQGSYPNELVEVTWPASYGDRYDFDPDDRAPGRLAVSTSSVHPEDLLQNGTLWNHLARHHVTFRNFGEGYDFPGGEGEPSPTGTRLPVNVPMPKVLFDNTSRSYPMFNTSIPDQYRFEQFRNEFLVRYVNGQQPLPQFLYIWLPNDHTARPRPADGYAYLASYVADNDLALGKLIELFSHSPFWNDMAIFITEDDAQGGRDHVDAHRSLLLVVSPYARRGVSHVHTSMASILKTFDLIFGLPPLNQYDAAATDLSDMFTGQPDARPYTHLPSDTRIFDPAKARTPSLGRNATLPPSEELDDPAVIRRRMREEMKNPDD
jgi:DNA-binding beta-propeller fold protein YncE